jgi:hypothetical protein
MPARVRMLHIARALLLVAMCAAVAAPWIRERRAVERIDALENDVAALRERLADEAAARAALERETRALRDVLADAAEPEAPATAGASAREDDAAVAAGDAETTEETDSPPSPPGDALRVEQLMGAGFRRDDVERFRARIDQIELERLYLRSRAAREGWLATPRFQQESAAIDAQQQGLRGEFGEELYDWLLYSTGQPNRVGVAEVLAGSPGESAGLANGDVIVRYDEQLMLTVADLLTATQSGRAGELVPVEVQRRGEASTVRLFLPRGPIGARIAPATLEPSSGG